MRPLTGMLFVTAGLGLASFQAIPRDPGRAEQLAEVTRISAAPDRSELLRTRIIEPSELSAPRVFSANAPLLTPTEETPAVAAAMPVKTVPTPTLGWSTVVIADPLSKAPQPMKSPRPDNAGDSAALTRDIQRELARVGCYTGDVNGSWSAPTRRAMAAFMDRVNAALPTAEPDFVLLTLVQAHRGTACGASCPSGQSLAGDGRCVPKAVMAQQARKDAKPTKQAVASAAAATKASGKKPSDKKSAAQKAPQPQPSEPASRIETASLAAKPDAAREVLPWQAAEQNRQPPVSVEPLPGRMAIGAGSTVLASVEPLDAPLPASRPEPVLEKPPAIVKPTKRLAALDRETAAPPPAVVVAGKKPAKLSKTAKRPPPIALPKPKKASRKYYVMMTPAGDMVRIRRGLPPPGSMPYMMMRQMNPGGFF